MQTKDIFIRQKWGEDRPTPNLIQKYSRKFHSKPAKIIFMVGENKNAGKRCINNVDNQDSETSDWIFTVVRYM